MLSELAQALATVDAKRLAADAAAFLRVPSPTGHELEALEHLDAQARSYGLESELVRHDLKAIRRRPGFPGLEAERSELGTLAVRLSGRGRPRLCLNGHVDVVDPGSEIWLHGPWSGHLADGRLHGRGAVDMKGAVIACLHALAAIRSASGVAPCDVVLMAVSSEEDGGAGTFAALEQDADFDACLIPEPTELRAVCAQAGALTFSGVVHGRSAHAAMRLEGSSAIDRYMRLHEALARYERRLNAGAPHELMDHLELPYPLSVGRLEAGSWSSSVPDRLRFEGRLGVRLDETPAEARLRFEQAVHESLDDGGAPVELSWHGGQYAPGETPVTHPFVQLVRDCAATELGHSVAAAGVSYGADMRLFRERGIPCVMLGPSGIQRAHAVDEWVDVAELVTVTRTVVRLVFALPGLRDALPAS